METRRRQLTDMENQLTEAKRLASDAGQLRTEVSELQRLKQSLEPMREEHDSLGRERDRVTNDLERARERLVDAEARVRAHEQAAMAAQVREMEAGDRLSSLQADAEATRNALQPIQEELASSRSELRDLDRKVKEAQSVIEQAETVREKAAAIEAVEAELSTTQTALEETKLNLRDAKNKLDETQEDTVQLLSRKSALEAELITLSGSSAADADVSDLQKRIADIWKPVLPLISAGTAASSEANNLERVQRYLTELGLIFHERTIHAFHTALKVAQEAPLVVLAGISGTGKSLLPQRYAEATGMNFLLVPVQPRWDGPQDLLGFYNFLQEKLVATEFLRALVQMHLYPDDWVQANYITDNSEHVSLKDQMLLVLLDEMNLARVEYYFSEFLSRLEIRRTIDDSDEHQRAKVSIPIDAGPLPSGLLAPRVYPGGNTLFVGTMNEDETTQSLSDKVVDRANVMRFARPTTPAAPESTGTPHSPQARLSMATWKGWKKEAHITPAERERIEGVTRGLNDALAEVGRPFGHRLTRAVITYAAMYPAHVEDRVDRALADQVEMRILPKLRGIELDERGERAIDQIQRIVAETNDAELSRAVDEASDTTSGRFHWLGVSRDTN